MSAPLDRRQAAILEFAHAFVTTFQNRAIHDRDSVHVEQSLVSLVVALRAAETVGVEMPLVLQFSDDAMFHDGQTLVAPSLQARNVLEELAARQVAALGFCRDLSVEEGNRLFDLLLLEQNRAALQRQHRDRALRALGLRNVKVTSSTPGDPSDRTVSVPTSNTSDLRSYQRLAKSLHENHRKALHDQSLALDTAASAIERAVLRLEQEPSGLLSLAAQDNVDSFTVGHSVRVALLALQVARAAGADREKLVEIGTAALLHDIGKSKVPQEILFKRGRLDDEEWQWMARHPRLGADILIEHSEFDPSAVGAAFCHHMRPDGSGYPHLKMPMRPSGSSRLIRVCDVFEALTSVRPYKRALTPLEAFAVMRRNLCDFDPQWFNLFVRTLGVFPQGSRVQLGDHSQALVVRQGSDPATPVIRLLAGPGHADLPADTPEELVIGSTFEGRQLRIAEVITHDRTVPVPDPDAPSEEYLTQAAHGACLPRQIQKDA